MLLYYFAYGANSNRQDMALRCPNAQWAGTATLADHQLRFRKHADVEPCQGSNVLGVLWLVDEPTLLLLDRHEGVPHYYQRQLAKVWQDGEPITAVIYQMVDQTFQDMPDNAYLAKCQAGYQQSNVPTDQLFFAIDLVKMDPQWDPIFNRIKVSPERSFAAAITKDEYWDLDT